MKKPKNILLLVMFLIATSTVLTSCLSDDNNEVKIDEVWKNRNVKIFDDSANAKNYDRVYTSSGGSSIFILKKDLTGFFKDYSQSSVLAERAVNYDVVEFTDSVYCRYEGWLIDANNEKYIFDSTENPVTGSTSKPNSVAVGFPVKGVVDGWRTALYDMKVGDEVQVIIPYQLAYGASGSQAIPGYTTLFFNMKLEKLVKMK